MAHSQEFSKLRPDSSEEEAVHASNVSYGPLYHLLPYSRAAASFKGVESTIEVEEESGRTGVDNSEGEEVTHDKVLQLVLL